MCKLSAFHCRLQGYTKPREYIVTEWPLKNSLGEFWSLVYDYECSAVVVLAVPDAGLVRNKLNLLAAIKKHYFYSDKLFCILLLSYKLSTS